MDVVYCYECGTEILETDLKEILIDEDTFQGYCTACLHDPESSANSGKVAE